MSDIISTLRDSLLSSKAKPWIKEAMVENGELTLLSDKANIIKLLSFLKTDKKCEFHMLISICGADYPERADRLEVVYQLLSLTLNQRIRIKVRLEEPAFIDSATDVFACANWYEREVYDMYGVLFKNHPDLRRILTDYGFEGYPLRKDFPLTGDLEVTYDFESGKVKYRPVSLAQEFRRFDFSTPWGGYEDVLPGDEKVEKNS
ncbi:MAG: NADH-quinone oxidoreductase subunit C [Candidatus Jidaibacter sp.]|jgi:NADH-quinone oxidoreductase subunit C|nr:NADH-quinone oxidoreductase subunit C [Candidatus Jidaibacter sp.]